MKRFFLKTNDIISLLKNPELAADLSNLNWQILIKVLRKEQLLARFAINFKQQNIILRDKELSAYLDIHLNNSIKIAIRQSQSVKFEIAELARQLGQSSQQLILLKGAAYSVMNNLASEGRTYGDIDLLSNKDKIDGFEKVLNTYGWTGKEVNDYDDKYYREWSHEIPPLIHSSRGTVIDLHHNLVPIISGRAPNIELFVKDAIPVAEMKVLRPSAMTLHSAVHLFLNEDYEHGLRNIHDISLLISEHHSAEYWADIYSLATDSNFTLELYLALRYCKKLFNTTVCESTYRKLSKRHSSFIKNNYWDLVFRGALAPKHPLVTGHINKVGLILAYIRGHAAKMPLKVLIPHIFTKAYREIVETFAGKSYFVKNQDTQND